MTCNARLDFRGLVFFCLLPVGHYDGRPSAHYWSDDYVMIHWREDKTQRTDDVRADVQDKKESVIEQAFGTGAVEKVNG